MKKRLFALCAVIVLALTLSLTAYADVLIELDDDFWRDHQGECDSTYRSYTVNGEAGYAAIWKDPLSGDQTEIVRNGERVNAQYHYTASDGEVWLAVTDNGSWGERGLAIRGWMRVSDCIPVADYVSFREAHGAEFTQEASYEGAFDDVETVVLWTYPCSGEVYADGIDAGWFREDWAFSSYWTDQEGRLWGYVGYCYGMRNIWLCISDPANANIPADDSVIPQKYTVYPAAEELPKPQSSGVAGSSVSGVTVALVSAVSLVTAILMAVFFLFKRP